MKESLEISATSTCMVWPNSNCQFLFTHALNCALPKVNSRGGRPINWQNKMREITQRRLTGPLLQKKNPFLVTRVLHQKHLSDRVVKRSYYKKTKNKQTNKKIMTYGLWQNHCLCYFSIYFPKCYLSVQMTNVKMIHFTVPSTVTKVEQNV